MDVEGIALGFAVRPEVTLVVVKLVVLEGQATAIAHAHGEKSPGLATPEVVTIALAAGGSCSAHTVAEAWAHTTVNINTCNERVNALKTYSREAYLTIFHLLSLNLIKRCVMTVFSACCVTVCLLL